MIRYHAILGLCLLFFSVPAYAAPSIEKSAPKSIVGWVPKPSVPAASDGHLYLRNNLVAYPFVGPFFNSSLEAAKAQISVAGAAKDIKTIGLSPSITAQFRVSDFALELGLQLSEIFGADSYSAYVIGATLNYGYSIGLKYSAYRNDRWQITPAIFYGEDEDKNFSPLSVASQAVSNPTEASLKDIISTTKTKRVRSSIIGAYTASTLLGVVWELGAVYQSSTGLSAENLTLVRSGISLDANFKPDLAIPMGAAIFFRNEQPISKNRSTSTSILGVGIYEMLSTNFNFGIEASRLMQSQSSLSLLLGLTAYY